jgi:raffinose/stachyose/melibiose transport system substrate-binding protein
MLFRDGSTRTSSWARAAIATALVVAACGGDDDGGGGAGGSAEGGRNPDAFSFLVINENTTIPDELTALSEDECAAENEVLPLDIETVPQAQLDQRLQLLAGQDDLPVMFSAGSTPQLTAELAEAGDLVDFEEALSDLGVADRVAPAAVDTIASLYGGSFNVLPYEFNIEGFWYNEQLFEDNGIDVPATWDELVDAAATLGTAGVQPFSASGEQGWPLTRLVSGYLFRSVGPDALQRVQDGDAQLTDPEYVEAAQAVADLGEAGYFGEGLGSIDYDTAINTFLTGDAGILYMGSWVLANFGDEEQNQIGADNIGFFPFPDVDGGEGNADQTPSNVGLPVAMSSSQYNDDVGAWLSCIVENYGATALEDKSSISGFVPSTTPDLDPLTQLVQDRVDDAQDTVLWFEALFDSRATSVSQTNAAPLVTGSTSAEDFMGQVQEALDAG